MNPTGIPIHPAFLYRNGVEKVQDIPADKIAEDGQPFPKIDKGIYYHSPIKSLAAVARLAEFLDGAFLNNPEHLKQQMLQSMAVRTPAGDQFINDISMEMRQSISFRDLNCQEREITDLSGLNLSFLDFDGANMTGVDMRNCKAAYAVFRNAILDRVKFDASDLEGVSFENACLDNVSFIATDLKKSSFSGAHNYNLQDRSKARSIDFRLSDMTDANFVRPVKSDLTNAKILCTQFPPELIMLKGDLNPAEKTFLPHPGEDKVILAGVNFRGRDLKAGGPINFSNMVLVNANFSLANLAGLDFSKSDLRGANFTKANLTAATLIAADLEGADFNGAELTNAHINQTNIIKAKNINSAQIDSTDTARKYMARQSTLSEAKREPLSRSLISNRQELA